MNKNMQLPGLPHLDYALDDDCNKLITFYEIFKEYSDTPELAEQQACYMMLAPILLTGKI